MKVNAMHPVVLQQNSSHSSTVPTAVLLMFSPSKATPGCVENDAAVHAAAEVVARPDVVWRTTRRSWLARRTLDEAAVSGIMVFLEKYK